MKKLHQPPPQFTQLNGASSFKRYKNENNTQPVLQLQLTTGVVLIKNFYWRSFMCS